MKPSSQPKDPSEKTPPDEEPEVPTSTPLEASRLELDALRAMLGQQQESDPAGKSKDDAPSE